MIHNKYFEILELFTHDYKREIYGRELIGKVNLSPKGIALALKELENGGILKSTKKGNMKFYFLNHNYSEIRETLTITELTKKVQFCRKHRAIAHLFNDDERIVGIFGSYAKGIQKTSSDIDVFIIGKKRDKDYDKKGKEFDIEINIVYFTEKQFTDLLNKKNNLLKEIIENHIILFNIEKFINIVWREYYGLSFP